MKFFMASTKICSRSDVPKGNPNCAEKGRRAGRGVEMLGLMDGRMQCLTDLMTLLCNVKICIEHTLYNIVLSNAVEMHQLSENKQFTYQSLLD